MSSTNNGEDAILDQDRRLLLSIHQIQLPKAICGLISMYVNDINERIKERASRIIKRIAESRLAGDNKTFNLRDLIDATVNATTDWAYNANTTGSLMWRFGRRPTAMQREQAIIETGLDFTDCEQHTHYSACSELCRNGRNMERSGNFVRGPHAWFRCVDYWHRGMSAPHRDGWVEGANMQ